jgi:trk system potassium uptake protein TrkA
LQNEGWGVDISVSTPQLITAIVEEAVSVGSLVRLLQFERGASHLVEVTLAPESPAVGSAIAALGIPREAAIVAIVRDYRLVVPRAETVLQNGDEVLVLVTQDAEPDVRKELVGA